jgi:hydrogenase maturation protein HypF
VAVKGLGGFHLSCDAENDKAVSVLRSRKYREDKPFAVMMADMAVVEKNCQVSEAERRLLSSLARPIVLLRRKPG